MSKHRRQWISATVTVILGLISCPLWAFEILTPVSRPCHERITLGAVEGLAPPWSSEDDPDVSRALALMLARVEAAGIPSDKKTQAFVEDVVTRYNIRASTPAERYLYASFVIGVRDPDTRGLSVVRFNNARETHIADDGQAEHALRRSFDDGEAGNAQALANIKQSMMTRFEQAQTRWRSEEDLNRSALWTLPLYGELNVRVFGPAFELGRMVHTIQDSYAHLLRHEDFSIVSVGNFVEVSNGTLEEERDGLGHSERMDSCALLKDEFDTMRVLEARKSSARWIATSVAAFEDPEQRDEVDKALTEIFVLRPGCNKANAYCGTPWLSPFLMDVTEPISLSLCSVMDVHVSTGLPSWPVAAGLLWLMLRRRRREHE